jgi:predicted transglutaminase-like cysteine proteinase
MKYTVGLSVLIATIALLPGLALAGVSKPPVASFMRIFGQSAAPSGYADFCQRNAASCRQPASNPGRLVLDQRRWNDLVEVNAIVNKTVVPRSDSELYGVSEYWTLPKRAGDCEDYGLLKQAMLIERGWPQGSLLMTVVRDEVGQGHAVLTVSTKSGDYILDNRQPAVVAWRSSIYEYVKRQSTFDPKVWLALEPLQRPAPRSIASQAPFGVANSLRR